MKLHLALALLVLLSCRGLLQAEDWTTTDGKIYADVKVIKTEPDAVTILYRDGGALIPLAKLSPALQKRFNYDPTLAQKAADARAKATQQSDQALQAEAAQAKKLQDAKSATYKAQQQAAVAQSNAATNSSSDSVPTLQSDPVYGPDHHKVGYPFKRDP
jgi:hypothetical protein